MDTEAEKTSLGAFERFLYWMFIPFVFTIVLVMVLLSLFDYDMKNQLQSFGHSMPLVGSLIPDPNADKKAGAKTDAPVDESAKSSQELAVAKQQAVDMKNQLAQNDAAMKQKDQTIKDLQTKLAAQEEQKKTQEKTDAEYEAQIQAAASNYAKMTPSKAAPILENLTPSERVLVLASMKQSERVAILEKMDPKMAADASIALKDVVPVKDRALAALQERVKLYEDALPNSGQSLTSADIGQTFSGMQAKNAATILLEMQNTNPDKVIEILKAADVAGRARIIAAMSDIDKTATASISAKLTP